MSQTAPNKPAFTGRYAAMQPYIAPINPQLWRLFAGLCLIVVLYTLFLNAYFIWVAQLLGQGHGALTMGRAPRDMVILLASFVFMALAVILAAIWPAQRRIMGLFGPPQAVRRDFWCVLGAIWPVLALSFVLAWAFDPSFSPNQTLAQILPWVPLALGALFVQVTAEEMVFRGYIMGQLAARFAHPAAWMVLPSALFGLVHYEPATYGDAAWIVCAMIMFWAMMISDLTARAGNLGPAIALHFGNNFLPVFLLGEAGKLDGLSLHIVVIDQSDPLVIVTQALYTVLVWLAARWALRV